MLHHIHLLLYFFFISLSILFSCADASLDTVGPPCFVPLAYKTFLCVCVEFRLWFTRAPPTDGRWVIHRQTVFLIDWQRLTNHEVLRRAVTRQSYVSLYLLKKTVISACLHHICNVCECAYLRHVILSSTENMAPFAKHYAVSNVS